MNAVLRVLLVATLLLPPASARGQVAASPDARAALEARDAPADLIDRVDREISEAAAEGLPSQALLDKALEGIAKGAPADRIVAAVTNLRHSLSVARGLALEAGLAAPPAEVITAAANALVRGLPAVSVRDLIRSSGAPDAAATGLEVASLLTTQGIDRSAAAQAVERAYRDGRSPTEVLELPSLAALMIARGMTVSDVTRRMLAGQPLAVDRPDVTGSPIAAPPQREGTGTTGNNTNTGTGKKP